jgi:hypothetical protein
MPNLPVDQGEASREADSDDVADILTSIEGIGDSETATALMEIYETTERIYRAGVAGAAPVGATVTTNADPSRIPNGDG